ncbi:DUF2382 domain-containing protein [Actinoalloteichus caeruleus]|uniref:PRC-barrel domain-containing protein n=1 Tax=Actinoalloteichus caeruleus DSM 43889 TaxID=1120930 RepID=A0ABT1JHK8_ACTCY|nr:PRC and DUF2382 domain-containing protein [Actinoalloteichus caeruleus]MCP2331995.1 PRC-barrel domain-containing protein [Actinoalloteichus caeruleus DSM 43889]
MTSDVQDIRELPGRTVYGADGQKIGKVAQVWLDGPSGEPSWLTVHTGLFGMHEIFVPMAGMHMTENGGIEVRYSKNQVKDAPHVSPERGELPFEEERRLYDYYGLPRQRESGEQLSGAEERTATSQDTATEPPGPVHAPTPPQQRSESGEVAATPPVGPPPPGEATAGEPLQTPSQRPAEASAAGATTPPPPPAADAMAQAADMPLATNRAETWPERSTERTAPTPTVAPPPPVTTDAPGTPVDPGAVTAPVPVEEATGREQAPLTTDEESTMTRFEERLLVRTERVRVGRARLRKYVVNETVQVNVSLKRERARLRTEAVSETERAAYGEHLDLGEEEQEIVLYEERPVISREIVPVERVRLASEVYLEEETITERVRAERIEVEEETTETRPR